MKGKYEPRQRQAIDGVVWWVPYNTETQKYSRLMCHGKYKTREKCAQEIEFYHNHPRWGLFA